MLTTCTTLLQLFRKDLLSFLRRFPSHFIDTLLFFVVNALVWGYFMPQQWTSASYAPFLVVGAIGSFGLIEVTAKVGELMADIEGDRSIYQLLLLPLPTTVLFCYIAIFWGITSMLLTFLLFPVAKLLLFASFSLEHLSLGKLIPIFITLNLFYGFFALWLVGLRKGVRDLTGLWARFISPMWTFGAYFYAWKAAYTLSPIIGYLSLLNPMVYGMEGFRGAVLGPEGYLPYGLCLGALWLFILLCGIDGVRRLKRRLDCL